MILKYVKIKNFRSIEDIQVDFNPTCRVLVGINESGKSNILKALSMISKSMAPAKEDIRESLPNEKSVEEAEVKFIFQLDREEIEIIFNNIKDRFLTKNLNKPILQNNKTKKKINLKEFCYLKNEGLYVIDIIKQSKTAKYWRLEDDYIPVGNWKKPSKNCPVDLSVDNTGKQIKVLECALIDCDEDYSIDVNCLENIELEYLNEIIGQQITKIIEQNLPDVIWWEYKDENLLQPSVDLNVFASNPASNVPLKSMFNLAGYIDIQQAINEAKEKSSNGLRNLLNRVATHTTKHFRSVWKEYKDIKFTLEPNANNVDAGVTEKNFWNIRQRSDGFKRFVTFLILISAQERTKQIKNTLILVDEPDVSLHPTGAKYLRDELIKISRNNYVCYSTHSIFMIDRNTLGRHIIVKKAKEKTNIETANESNVFDEEVLYNAIGSSVFEVLKEENIIFEGWCDKKLFETALSKFFSNSKEIKQYFNNFGYCHAQGVKDISRITPMLELACRKCIIISDADKPAREKQKKYKENKGYGEWKTYNEIDSSLDVTTGEDFIKVDNFSSIRDKIKIEHSITTNPNFSDNKGKIYAIRKWLTTSNIDTQTQDDVIRRIKEEIFNDLKIEDIEDKYFNFLTSFKTFLENKEKS